MICDLCGGPSIDHRDTMRRNDDPRSGACGLPLEKDCLRSRQDLLPVPPTAAETYLSASQKVATEQTRYAEAFLRFKARTGTSDGQAREQATVETGAALTVALAEQEIARIRLQNS